MSYQEDYRKEQEQRSAAEQVAKAWNVPGEQPGYHFAQIGRLHDEWPVLAAAITRLAAAYRDA